MLGRDVTLVVNFEYAGSDPEPPVEPTVFYVKVGTDKDVYSYNSQVYITVMVKDNPGEAFVHDAVISVTIEYPLGDMVASYDGLTDSGGTVTFSYRVMNKSLEGNYEVKAEATKGNITKTGSGAFTVKRK